MYFNFTCFCLVIIQLLLTEKERLYFLVKARELIDDRVFGQDTLTLDFLTRTATRTLVEASWSLADCWTQTFYI